MKSIKIGLLYGAENTFPMALQDRLKVYCKNTAIEFKPILIDKISQLNPSEYHVILDRVSQDIPFYQGFLKNACLQNVAVLNNPFWTLSLDKFFGGGLAQKLGINTPKTYLIPSKDRPKNTAEVSFRNMAYPLDWDSMFKEIGFPAYIKPYNGGGSRNVFKVDSKEDLWAKQAQASLETMLLQEEIVYEDYYRCYIIGNKYINIMPYEPKNAPHLKYATKPKTESSKCDKLFEKIKKDALKLNLYLGYDFNTIEFAIKNGKPYVIDFLNPVPDSDIHTLGTENFEWIVNNTAKYLIERAEAYQENQNNCTWSPWLKEMFVKISKSK
jgi:glutathione synthase/RimK-type ligase-like ATP-grasp enzyme